MRLDDWTVTQGCCRGLIGRIGERRGRGYWTEEEGDKKQLPGIIGDGTGDRRNRLLGIP